MSVKEEFERIVSEIDRLIEERNKIAQDAFKEIFDLFFVEHPKAKSVCWKQYTDYFNDGDACTFSVHDWSVSVNGSDGDDTYRWSANDYEENVGMTKEEFDKALEAAGDIVGGFDEDVMFTLFGDHAQIHVSREEISVEDYSSHD